MTGSSVFVQTDDADFTSCATFLVRAFRATWIEEYNKVQHTVALRILSTTFRLDLGLPFRVAPG